tara:strand:+ start:910 stop:1077 length:168 start_codon:yes stop_codon:yes gene_type:complete
MAKYKLIEHNGKTVGVLKQEDIPANMRVSIPCDPANTDYQEYLEWAKTNTAEAAD